MDPIEKAKMLIHTPAPDTGAAHSANLTQITGEAVSDSIDGAVMVNLGGHTVSSDDTQTVEIPCTCDVREGDMVLVQLAGADGSAKGMTVTGVVGGGDRAREKTEEAAKTATNFLSYSETSGLIISEDASTTDGWNTRIDSDGLDIRNGENVVTHYGDNVIFYDGANEEALKITDSGLRVRFKDNAVESKDSGFLASNESGNVLTWIGSGRIYQKVDETNIGYPVLEASLSAEGLDYRASDKASGTPGSSLADGYFENISPGFIGASSCKTNDDNTTQARAMIELRPNQIAVSSYTLSLDDTSKSDEKSTAITPEKVDTGEFIQNSHSLLTPENLTEDLKGNLGPNATTGKTGSHFSIIRIGQLVIASLNMQTKPASGSNLSLIWGLPTPAYPVGGVLSYRNGSSLPVFMQTNGGNVYVGGNVTETAYVEGQLVYVAAR